MPVGVLLPDSKRSSGSFSRVGTVIGGAIGAYKGGQVSQGMAIGGAVGGAVDSFASSGGGSGSPSVPKTENEFSRRIELKQSDPYDSLRKASIAMESAPKEIRDQYSSTIDDALKAAQSDRRYV